MASKDEARPPRDKDTEGETIFRKTITLKNGRVLIAAEYGLEAFPIKVRPK